MIAITNARLFPVSSPPIVRGSLIVEHGKIVSVGTDLEIPAGIEVIDARGRTVTPGLIEAHCHVGLTEVGLGWEGADANESSSPITPQVRAIDGLNPLDGGFADFRAAGITTANVLPGSTNVIGGLALAVKCTGCVVDQMVVRNPSGVKAALGENPKSSFGARGKAPSTRMGIAAILRETLHRAQDYQGRVAAAGGDPAKQPKFDPACEALLPLMERRIPLVVHAHRADDIATAIRIAREFGLRLCLEHATEVDQVLDLLDRVDVHLAFGPVMKYASTVETRNRDFRAPLAAARAGLPFCFVTDHPNLNGKYLTMTAALAVAWGMEYDAALNAITLGGSEHAGISDRVGSLEVGKDADLVIWSGDPLEFATFADVTMINGSVVYRREVG